MRLTVPRRSLSACLPSLSLSLPHSAHARLSIAAFKELFPDIVPDGADFQLLESSVAGRTCRPYLRTSVRVDDITATTQAQRVRDFVVASQLVMGSPIDYRLTNGKSGLLPLAQRGGTDIRHRDLLVCADADRLALSAADAALLVNLDVTVIVAALGMRPLDLASRDMRVMWSAHALFRLYFGVWVHHRNA